MKTRLLLLGASAVAAFAIVGTAQAHVTVRPNALPSGGFTVINIQVPNERGNASTVRVDVQFPSGIFIASRTVMPGWKGRVITKKLPNPVEIEPGFSVTSRVDRVVFSGGRIGPGQFLSVPVSIKAPAVKAGTLLTFKALQTYSNGEVVRWIGNPSADEPAPQVLIRQASSPVLDYPAGASAAEQGVGEGAKASSSGYRSGCSGRTWRFAAAASGPCEACCPRRRTGGHSSCAPPLPLMAAAGRSASARPSLA